MCICVYINVCPSGWRWGFPKATVFPLWRRKERRRPSLRCSQGSGFVFFFFFLVVFTAVIGKKFG